MPQGEETTVKNIPIEEKVIFSWKAKARPFERRSKDVYVTIVAVAVLFGLILFIIEGLMPVILLAALVFLFYVLSTVEPENVEYQITNLGIKIAGKRTDWERLGRFWFTERLNHTLLVVEVASVLGRLEMVVNDDDEEKIKRSLSEYLVNEEVPPSFFDKAVNWASKKLPQSK